jgi:hypothetical protein
MELAEYVGLDVSMKETAVSIRRDGKRVWRGKCASDPKILAEVIRRRAPEVARVVFETGPLSVWFYHALTAEGLPAICLDARHAKAALDMAPNKTDANDADGLAQLAEVGFFREVRVKGFNSMLARALVAVRNRLVQITTELSNPDPRSHEDVWPARSCGQGKQVRGACPRAPYGSGGAGAHHSSRARGVAGHAPARGRAWTAARRQRPPERGMPDPHVGARHRCRDRDLIRDCDRGSRDLPQVTIGRRLARANDQALSIW